VNQLPVADVFEAGPGAARSKADHAYACIRQHILDGHFHPGDRLVIEQLARQIEVSVVPVREAIRRLEAEGYVTYTRNVGATVASVDMSRYPETVETLAILEGAATGLAAPFLRSADVKKARRVNAALRRSVEAADPSQFAATNQQFHRTLFERCPNRHLNEMVLREWDLLNTTRRSTFSFVPERAIESVAEHELLLQLIERAAPPAQVENYAREHRLRTVRYLLRRIAEGTHEFTPATSHG
jgi:DNA-binding GntR family transcriptional regulator